MHNTGEKGGNHRERLKDKNKKRITNNETSQKSKEDLGTASRRGEIQKTGEPSCEQLPHGGKRSKDSRKRTSGRGRVKT